MKSVNLECILSSEYEIFIEYKLGNRTKVTRFSH